MDKSKTEQPDLFSAQELRDIGMSAAIQHADEINAQWSEKAYIILLNFIKLVSTPFMVEEVRKYATEQCNLPEPPSKRAWGSIIIRAVKSGMVKRVGFKNTTNPKAHSTPATLWQKT